MPAAGFVRPLEDAFQPVIDAVLKRRGSPTLSNPAALAPKLRELSQAYNTGLIAGGATKAPLEARIAFSFARDVPKGAGAVRELLESKVLVAPEGRPLRIVDLGAGLGAMSWGIGRAVARASSGARVTVEALLVDEDDAALGAAALLANEAEAHLATTNLDLRITTRKERLAPGMKLPVADLVVLGQVLSELDVGLEPAARVEKHAALVRDLLARVVADDGALVIVEPALRERTRHLHAVRDALTASATVFAPCLHRAACPMLATATEWCHEDLPVDLPPWLVPLARAAGLRYQGLTFTHLVLRRDGKTLVSHVPPAEIRFRVVSELLRTKGKAEVFGCTEEGARVRLRRLDRDKGADAATATWDSLGRGDVVGVSGAAPIDDRGRVNADAALAVWPQRAATSA